MKKNKIPFFSKSYTYNIDKNIKIEEILSKWQKKDYGHFKLKRKISEEHYVYQYLISSRAGEIFIHLEKEENTLYVHIQEGLFGFFLPIVFLSFTIFSCIKQVYDVCFYSLLGFGVFFCLILFSFNHYNNQIKTKIEKELTNM